MHRSCATASIDSTPNPTWILKPFTTGFVVISEIKKLEEKFAPQFNTLGENGQALLVAFNNLASAIKASSEQDNKGSGEQLKYPSDKTQTMNDMLESLFGMMKSLLLAVSENNQDEVHRLFDEYPGFLDDRWVKACKALLQIAMLAITIDYAKIMDNLMTNVY
ncbi:hypothetical protein BX070DRAFT_245604 [Coemansia spiralis]|nr:hypothetical protein BX070DRAFT_245604 [Coemansia spiralis]